MAIIRWRPFGGLDKFSEEDWDAFPVTPFRGIKIPEVDVYQTNKDVVVEIPLAGVKAEDVNISVEDDVLTVKGESKEEKEEKKRNYWRKEIRKGAFERSIPLPTKVKGEKAVAESRDGMLKITLPKVEVKKVKKIAVKVKNR